MGFAVTDAEHILKVHYHDKIVETLNSGTVLLDNVERTSDHWNGYHFKIPAHTGRNYGTGGRPEDADLPTAGKQKFDGLIYNFVSLYATVRVTGQVISKTTGPDAFVQALESEFMGAARDARVDLNRQIFGDGSMVLTRTDTTSASTTVNVNSTRFLIKGMPITIANGADGASSITGRTVSSISSETAFVISGAAISADTDDVVVKAGVRDPTDWTDRNEVWGLEALIRNANPGNASGGTGHGLGETGDNLIGNVTRTTELWHRANAVDASAPTPAWNAAPAAMYTDQHATVIFDLMQQAFDQSEIEGDSEPGFIITNHRIKRSFGGVLLHLRRYPPGGEVTLNGGYKALEFNGAYLVADKDAHLTGDPAESAFDRIYFLTMSQIKFLVLSDWDWITQAGDRVFKVTNRDAFEGTYRTYRDLAVLRSNAHSYIHSIANT